MSRIDSGRSRRREEMEFIRYEEFRKDLGDIALRVAKEMTSVAVGTNSRRPTYVLEPASVVPKHVLATACRIGPDEARRSLSSIRALIRVEDGWAFAIVISGEAVAVLRRHPRYEAKTIDKFRQMRRERLAIAAYPTIDGRLDALERAVNDLTAELRKAR